MRWLATAFRPSEFPRPGLAPSPAKEMNGEKPGFSLKETKKGCKFPSELPTWKSIINLFGHITLDQERCFGKTCVRGVRLPISSILGHLAAGMSEDEEEILREWPDLELEDIH
jgi:uncharacterized protein (DUF433 family)